MSNACVVHVCSCCIADENNTALRWLDGLDKSLGRAEKKAEDAAKAKERLEKEVAAAVEAQELLRKDSVNRERDLADAAAAREKEMADRLMAAAKDFFD